MEIEKKYLIKKLPDTLNDNKCYIIEQAYLSDAPVVRVRKRISPGIRSNSAPSFPITSLESSFEVVRNDMRKGRLVLIDLNSLEEIGADVTIHM